MKKYEPLSVIIVDINIKDDILTASELLPKDDTREDPFN